MQIDNNRCIKGQSLEGMVRCDSRLKKLTFSSTRSKAFQETQRHGYDVYAKYTNIYIYIYTYIIIYIYICIHVSLEIYPAMFIYFPALLGQTQRLEPYRIQKDTPRSAVPTWMMTISWAESSKPSLGTCQACHCWDLNVIECDSMPKNPDILGYFGNLLCDALQCRGVGFTRQ